MENKRGRPPLPEGERKGHMLRIRMTEEERALLDSAAQRDDKETSAWARDTLFASARRRLDKK